ncbi:type IV pilus twitching motility protein PilT [Selenihalanaerobacter shriftii]|uniref:Twitching motility protein PilT n=1 Tax=Selenihalanaerobacter shriftii TaxID=142842 RepID=A0A1T4P4J9_9FIRM|nr:type IV pilus twitching motility protein PilT [Selenihalanaerobacter shriftii]SJZ86352.1 twitching motility protein PilT [Selenihalanaerobacter shriftii]
MELVDILQKGIKLGASDIHLTVGINPTYRVNGRLRSKGTEVIESDQLNAWVKELMGPKQEEKFESKGQVDFTYYQGKYTFRVNAFHQRGNPAVVLRVIPNEIMGLNTLGLPDTLEKMALKPRGLFVVTGPTGSGKSTTLAAMIDLINRRKDKHIVTLEDPIEYVHQHKKSIVNQRAVGIDTDSFANGLRSALRQDPDIIMVGEMRDRETISTTIEAAETGHFVLATMHTNSALETIERIINSFPPYQQPQIRIQLALTLKGVLSQQLIPTFDNLDRVVATELLIANAAVQNLIREGKTYQLESIMQTSKDKGMHTMDNSLCELYSAGKISRSDALSRAVDVQTLRKRI